MSKAIFHVIRERDLEIESRSREPDYHLQLLQMRNFNTNQKYKNKQL